MYNLGDVLYFDEEASALVPSGKKGAVKTSVFIDKDSAAYSIHKYDRTVLNADGEDSGDNTNSAKSRLLRSVITRGREILCFSPPKSVPWDAAMEEVRGSTDWYLEEFVEGVMINVFYDPIAEKHIYATKSSINGNVTFFDDGAPPPPTFGELFVETCAHVGLVLADLERDVCYSFVMRHPRYRIVCPVGEPSLTLVAVYRIDSKNMRVCDIVTPRMQEVRSKARSGGEVTNEDVTAIIPGTRVRGVKGYSLQGDELTYATVYRRMCAISEGRGFENLVQGITLSYHDSDGVYRRAKIRDPRHQQIKALRGNNPKLEYQYYVLASSGKIGEYLGYYPEHRAVFGTYRTKVGEYVAKLYQYYREIYILKQVVTCEKCKSEGTVVGCEDEPQTCTKCKGRGEYKRGTTTLGGVPFEYRAHLRHLHTQYVQMLFAQNSRINHDYVRKYVAALNPAQIMFAVNYSMRKKKTVASVSAVQPGTVLVETKSE